MAAGPSARSAAAAACEADGERSYRARRIAAAERQFERAIALGGDPQNTIEMRWMCAMLRGDFEAAWRISDEVLRQDSGKDFSHLPLHLRRVWRGEPLAGQSVLVRCYHGLGDAIQFIRFVPAIAATARSVAVEAPEALIALFRSMPEIAALVPLGATPPPYDVDIEAMEIPHALRVTLPRLPADVPYLGVGDAAAAARAALSEIAGKFKVGVVWEAGRWRPERSLSLALVARLARIPDVALVNLQRGPAGSAADRSLFGLCSGSDSVAETAALVGDLDLVVAVDTMVAHLAGALGRPVVTLLHFAADWRWLLDRPDSPWYPTMHLLRQMMPGDWSTVMDELCRMVTRQSRR
jgi:hypothetical protein